MVCLEPWLKDLRLICYPDVIANNMVGGRDELKSITYSTIIRATIVGGLLYLAVDENDQVVGTACWYPPGSDFLAECVSPSGECPSYL